MALQRLLQFVACAARGLMVLSCLTLQPVVQAAGPEDDIRVIAQAERRIGDGPFEPAALPDTLHAPAGAAEVRADWRMRLDAIGPPTGRALYLSGVIGNVRIALNGHVLLDTATDAGTRPPPRGIDQLRLLDLPPHLLRDADNVLDVSLRAPRMISLSRVAVGAERPLRAARDSRAWWTVYAPALVATLMVCLGASVLLIGLRRPADSYYVYFGVAAVAWGLHIAWTVAPHTIVPARHYSVWWDTLYYFFVALLTVFCVRFAGYRFRRGARWLMGSVLLVPVSLYATQGHPIHQPMHEVVRVAMVTIASAAMLAAALSAWRRRSIETALLVGAGLVATGFGVRDWLVFHAQRDNLPIQFAMFAGLPFVALVAWVLIDRFVRASESLESLNRELEQRVQAKSAELVGALDDMRAARDAAEAANRAKGSFLAAASHDLRQPIHALGLYMSALPRLRLDAEAREVVQRMDSSVAALDSLLNALLDVSRIDAGSVVPQPRPIDLAQLLRRLVAEMAPGADASGLRFALRIGAGPATAQADPVLLERVLRNLIDNAIKYTDRGGVLVSCRAGRGPPRRWRIEVWDSGAGIAATERERVFEEFYQVGNPERDRRAGIGLGLSIVRRLARLMQLPLELHSRLGRGTRFAIEVPASDAPVPREAACEPAGSLDGCVVAVVEDDAEVLGAMVTLLHGWGCVVLAGVDADEVLRLAVASASTPRAVIADLRLRDGRDGLQAITLLRERFGAALPALVVSGDSAPERLHLLQQAGVPWLPKPVAAAQLRSWLVGVTRAAPPVQSAAAGAEAGEMSLALARAT